MTAVSEDALQGSLADFPLPALIRSLEARERTGVLVVADRGEIWLHGGQIYLATTTGGPSLPAVLYGADVGNFEDLEALFADADGRSVLRRILDTEPSLEPMIRRLLHEYTVNALFERLLPPTAAFAFHANQMHQLGPDLRNDTATVLAQAEHRVETWRRIANRIRSTDAKFRLASVLPESEFGRIISPDEWRFLACLDGHSSVADVIAKTGAGAFQACATIYQMLAEGLIVEAR